MIKEKTKSEKKIWGIFLKKESTKPYGIFSYFPCSSEKNFAVKRSNRVFRNEPKKDDVYEVYLNIYKHSVRYTI